MNTNLYSKQCPQAFTTPNKRRVPLMLLAPLCAAISFSHSSSAEIEEVVVTASKRGASNIQDITSNISALGSESLKKIGANGFRDFAKHIAGLSSIDNGPGNQQIIIRGLASSTGAAQVGTYFDEIPASGSGGTNVRQTDLQLYDLERVEVLRGPQGTLYGGGSQGGTIRYISNKPNFEKVEGSVQMDAATRSRNGGETYQLNAMINAPVVEDVFALRAVAFYRDGDGYANLPDLNQRGTDTEETLGGRVMARWNISDNTKLDASVWYQNMEVGDRPQVTLASDSRSGSVKTPFDDKLKMANITLEHSFDAATLTLTHSDYSRDALYVFDVSQFVPGSGGVFQTRDTQLSSSEVRLASNLDGNLQYIVGAFYQQRQADSISAGFFVDDSTGNIVAEQTKFFDTRTDAEFSNKAIFGEVTFQATEQLELLAGFRSFKLTTDSQANELLTPFGPPSGLADPLHSESDDTIFKLQASYDFSEDALAYLVFSEGFREGGANNINLLTSGGDPAPASFDPDFVKNLELGWKTQYLNKQLTVNGAIYFMQWEDSQVGLLDQNQAFGYTDNAGKASLKGIELETRISPDALAGFSASINLNYSEQQLDENTIQFNNGDDTAGKEGDDLPSTSPISAGIILEQRFELAGQQAFVNFNASYTGKALTTYSYRDSNARKIGDYVLAGARMGLETESWSASLYINNLFDERKPVNWTVEARPGIPDRILTTQPRAIGINLEYHF